MRDVLTCLLLSMVLLGGLGEAEAQPLRLVLPTDNDALLRDDAPRFYQYTYRYFNGRRSRPWQGGQYGFVRNPRNVRSQIIYTRFHEGLDIRSVQRSPSGEPLDAVRVIDGGRVAHVNAIEKQSNYGLYVVVEHWWDGAPFYTLYAHLNAIRVAPGQYVERGQRLGTLGYTGRGIDRRRAHLHFEVNLLLNQSFPVWHDSVFSGENHHGIYNGINLAGLDAAGLFRRTREDSTLTIRRFLEEQEAFFTVAVPNAHRLDLLTRYPWLWTNAEEGERASWEIDFARSGLPLRVRSSEVVAMTPVVLDAAPADVPYRYLTEGWLDTGEDGDLVLTERGQRYLRLIMLPPPAPLAPRPIYQWW
jgi:murein DD-endopeptidase MepM/ murein hydrolase activator NlpD